MKKIILLLFLVMFSVTTAASSKTLKVFATVNNDFSTKNPPETLKITIHGNYKLDDKTYLPDETMLSGDVVKVVRPKACKRDAYAYYYIREAQNPRKHKFTKVTGSDALVKLSRYTKDDAGDMIVKASTDAADFLVKTVSYPLSFVVGSVEPVPLENAKKNSSVISKGKHLELSAGDPIIVTFTYDDISE